MAGIKTESSAFMAYCNAHGITSPVLHGLLKFLEDETLVIDWPNVSTARIKFGDGSALLIDDTE